MTSRLALAYLLLAAPAAAQGADELDFLTRLTESRELRNMLPSHLRRKAYALLDERRAQIARLSAQDVAARKTYVRERMLRALGGLPERTPLNARTVGVVDRDGYRIEKIIFESQPKFYVTANLYLPKTGSPPYPAILYPLGHESGAKAHIAWQQTLGSLATKGFVGLAWDPIGQGERVQIYDPDLKESKLRSSTIEHTVLGAQCLLVGDNVARYTIWDGLRALDYLLSRKEVDPKRIGCTGNSGGGTHTAYLSALDDRIQVAAPSCYLTSWQRLLESIGPQDAEQCLPPWLAAGLDHGDFVHAFAGKPYLFLSAIRDFFSISGARETFAEAKRVYGLLGAGDKLAMFEADDGHGYTKPRREAAYRWFSRWLKGAEDDSPEPDIQIASEEELYCTPTGQVATSLGGETAHSLNVKRFEPIRRAPAEPAAMRRTVRELTGYEPPSGPPAVRPYGVIARRGYRIEKLVYQSEPGIRVPALLLLPEAGPARKPAFVFVHGRGKAAAAAPGGDAEKLAQDGFAVLAIDARGFGETRPALENKGAEWIRWFGDYDSAMTALLIGKTLVGLRARDIVSGVDLLAARSDIDPERIYGIGKEAGAVPLLFAAVLDDRIRRVDLEGMLESYESVVRYRLHRQVFEQVVPGALRHFDLPDLVKALAPRQVRVVNPVDPLGFRASR